MSTSRKLLSGVGWGGVSLVVVASCQVVFLAVLARLLTPADFGLVAMGNICLRFLSYFSQLGVTPALVQKRELRDDDVAAALSVSLGISVLAALLAAAAAPWAAQFFSMPALAGVILVLALGFPLQSLGSVSTGLLRRSMRFRALGIIDAVAYVLGYGVVGIGLAWAGHGVWALVGAALSQTFVSAALSFSAVRHPLTLRHSASARRHFLSYGGRYSLTGFCEFLSGNLDALAVGKVLGDTSAGLYNRTMTLANLPVQQPATVITRALFPVLSAAGADRQRQAIGLQLSLLSVGGYAFAAAATLSAAAVPVVHTLLGSQWVAVIPVLQVFALSVGPRFVTHVVGVSLDALGELRSKLMVQFGCLWLMLLAVVLALPHGLVAMAAAVLIVEVIRMILLLAVAVRALRISASQCWLTAVPLLLVAAMTAGAVAGVLHLMPEGPHWISLLLATIAAGLAIVTTGALCRRWLARLDGIGWVVLKLPRLARLLPQHG